MVIKEWQKFWQKLSRNQRLIFSTLLSLLILGPLAVIFTAKTAQIAQLNIPATPPITPPTCDQVAKIHYTIPCDPFGFHQVEFECGSGTGDIITDYNVCREANDWYQLALNTCAQCPEPSPTSSPTPTSKPSPSLPPPPPLPSASPISSPFPSPPLPSAPPIPNNTPVIFTSRLPMGRINRRYRQSVTGYDLDTNDVLSLAFTRLPRGLKPGTCQQGITPYQGMQYLAISCDIVGKPTRAGFYTITATIKDNHGASSNKKIRLNILPL